jgi:hypothetical protein
MEGALRFLPVSSGLYIQPVDQSNVVFKARPNTTVNYSSKWNFKNANKKHVNNAGFMNKQDYIKESTVPLIAVVGDSFIEAMQVPDDATYPAILQAHYDKMRVYSFGFSGAPLSQYLIWAQHAKQNYNNQYLIINVVGNDFDESLLKYYSFVKGFHHYVPESNGTLKLQRSDWQPQRSVELAKKSRLLSYLVRNLEITNVKNKMLQIYYKPQYVGNVAAVVDDTRFQDSYNAVDAFLRDLPQYSGLQPRNVMFVIDDRTTVYGEEVDPEAYFAIMKLYFTSRARALGYTVLDTAPAFKRHFAANQQRFEFSHDWHWNSTGHAVVASAIESSDWWQNVYKISS